MARRGSVSTPQRPCEGVDTWSNIGWARTISRTFGPAGRTRPRCQPGQNNMLSDHVALGNATWRVSRRCLDSSGQSGAVSQTRPIAWRKRRTKLQGTETLSLFASPCRRCAVWSMHVLTSRSKPERISDESMIHDGSLFVHTRCCVLGSLSTATHRGCRKSHASRRAWRGWSRTGTNQSDKVRRRTGRHWR